MEPPIWSFQTGTFKQEASNLLARVRVLVLVLVLVLMVVLVTVLVLVLLLLVLLLVLVLVLVHIETARRLKNICIKSARTYEKRLAPEAACRKHALVHMKTVRRLKNHL